MKKWLGGLLALVVAIGFGMGWNYMWSKSSRDKESSDPTSVVAEAEETLTDKRIQFRLVDRSNSKSLGTISVELEDSKIPESEVAGKQYSKLLEQVKESSKKDYKLLMQYYGLKSSLEGENNGLLNNIVKGTGFKLTTLWKLPEFDSTMGYTLNENEFNSNLGKTFKVSFPFRKTAVVEVPYQRNDLTTQIQLKKADRENKISAIDSYTINGASGITTSLEFLKYAASDDEYDLSPKQITFSKDNSENIAWLISKDYVQTKTIIYVDESGMEIGKLIVKGGLGTTTEASLPKDISEDYQLKDSAESTFKVTFSELPIYGDEMTVKCVKKQKPSEGGDSSGGGSGGGTTTGTDESSDSNGDTDTDVNAGDNSGNNAGNNTGNSNANNTTTSVSPFKVYGKKKLYRYSHATFTNNRRVQTHAKKVKAHAPVFTVVGKTTSKTGAARYVLNDGTHITAKADYVGKLYWASDYRKLYVTHPKGINTYKSTTLNQKVKSLKQGTAVTVKAVAKKGQMTRYRLADGTYITGNKQYVSPTKPKTVKQVKAKTRVRVYQDVNLNKVVKTYQPGKVIKVNGWNHSRGDVHHVSGVKRYKVAGGYITANSKYVKVVK